MSSNSNSVEIGGQIVKVYPVRYTLQKIPVISFVIQHKSLQIECERSRDVKCRIFCITLEHEDLSKVELLDKFVEVTGFLSQNAKSQLVLHIKTIKILDKGN